MRSEERSTRVRRRARGSRLLVAALLVGSTFAGIQQAGARPTHADLQAAKSQLDGLNQRLEGLVEQYDQAQIALSRAERHLAQAKAALAEALSQARSARHHLATRASLAYQGVSSELDTLLGANTFSQFSDRLEFLNQIAGTDEDAVTKAAVAGQKAKWARHDLSQAVAQRQAVIRGLSQKKAEIQGSITDQRALIDRIQTALARPIYVPQKAPAHAPSVSTASTADPPQSAGSAGPAGPAGPAPIVNGSVQAVIDAAYSVIGVPYVYGGSSPETGFDCSGLTMWAWAHAGVSLPHSAAMQYESIPHVDRSELQPGDLVFFYSPISHVAMYVGGGMMIEAPHTGAYVRKVPLRTDFVGAGRP